MSNPPKAKGTGGETELLRIMQAAEPSLRRTAASSVYDLESEGAFAPIELLGTRPDRGQWLITMAVPDFNFLWSVYKHSIARPDMPRGFVHPMHVEVKRFKKFAHHTIFEGKFGRHK